MTQRTFHPQLWEQDLSLLSPGQQELAREALRHASETLACAPYHRSSKGDATSDRQTLFRHPRTGHVCFVLSVVPDQDDKRVKVFRIDFFDAEEHIDSDLGAIHRAPRTQWSKKGERRLIASRSGGSVQLRTFLDAVVARH